MNIVRRGVILGVRVRVRVRVRVCVRSQSCGVGSSCRIGCRGIRIIVTTVTVLSGIDKSLAEEVIDEVPDGAIIEPQQNGRVLLLLLFIRARHQVRKLPAQMFEVILRSDLLVVEILTKPLDYDLGCFFFVLLSLNGVVISSF